MSRPPSLAVRFLAAILTVAVVTITAAAAAGLVIAPGVFHDHLHEALPAVSTAVLQQVDAAFWSANTIAFAIALPAAVLTSIAASYVLSRRLRRSTRPLAAAAAQVAAGRYDVQVSAPRLGREFEELIAAFNHMALRLKGAEDSRRQLLADVTHELRTPVATLAAYIEGLEDGIATLDEPTSAILRAQTSRLARLTDDMAAVSLAQEHQPSTRRQRTAPADLLTTAQAAFAARFTAKTVTLIAKIGPGLPAVDVDPDRMGQVLANLLDNALRHTPPGGSVTLAARSRGTGLELIVTDTGEGIEAQHVPLIFDRFYRVDSARSRGEGHGSGIGLAIVKSLVETQGGRVRAHSAGPGRGSSITISFPGAPGAGTG